MKKAFLTLFVVLGGLSGVANAYPFFDLYGSIAYSPSTGAWGYATDQPNIFAAQSLAQLNCVALDCRAVVTVRNGCAALSVGWNRGFGWGLGFNRFAAASNAQISCNRLNGPCQLKAWTCTSGH